MKVMGLNAAKNAIKSVQSGSFKKKIPKRSLNAHKWAFLAIVLLGIIEYTITQEFGPLIIVLVLILVAYFLYIFTAVVKRAASGKKAKKPAK
jgi:hypothetical protein